MAKIIDWYTVGETSYESFEKSVLAKIQAGYQPHGNFSLLPKGERNQYLLLQTMAKYQTPVENPIVDFYIIGQTNYDSFDQDVLAKVQQGFEPLGSAAVMRNPNANGSFEWLLMQIMVKYATAS